jgi:Tn3 transposase DDE domain
MQHGPLCINRKGEIRDRSSDRQAVRAAGLNFLAAVVIYYNTLMLGEILADPEVASTLGRPDLLTHASPLCWDHILLTGEYSWSERSIPTSAPKT